MRRFIRAGIAWLGPTFLGKKAVRLRLNYAMHSIDDLRDAEKGLLHSRRLVIRETGVGDTRLGTAKISSRDTCVGSARQWEKSFAWQG